MIDHRRAALAAMVAGASTLGACQVLTGLSGLHEESSGGTGGSTSSASSGKGGASTSASSGNASAVATGPSSSASGGCGSMTDAHNCGTCGHDCLSGACVMGECRGFVLTTSPTIPTNGLTALASDGAFVYWAIASSDPTGGTSNGEIWRFPIANSGQPLRVVKGGTPRGLVTDGNMVYWTDSSTNAVMNADVNGTDQGGMPLYKEMVSYPQPIVLAAGMLFWGVPATGSISTGTTSAGSVTGIGTGVPPLLALAADASDVFFYGTSGIEHTKLAPPYTSKNVAPSPSNASGIALDEQNGDIYWTVPDQVLRAKMDGSTTNPTSPPGKPVFPASIIALGGSAIWAEAGSSDCSAKMGSVNHWTKDDTVDVLDSGLNCPLVAQDANNVYWSSGPIIYRMVK